MPPAPRSDTTRRCATEGLAPEVFVTAFIQADPFEKTGACSSWIESRSPSDGFMVRDAPLCGAPHHEGKLDLILRRLRSSRLEGLSHRTGICSTSADNHWCKTPSDFP